MAFSDTADSWTRRWWNLAAVAVIVIALGARPGLAQTCVGDCGGNGVVAINEIIECVNIALGSTALPTCSACSSNGQDVVISDVITAVNNALNGCPLVPTATATAQSGTPIASATPTPMPTIDTCLGKPDGTTCDAGTDTAVTQICVSGSCEPCAPIGSPSPQFVDNGDGTITDRRTCLVWEKKSADNGIHDKDRTFDWSTGTNDPDGEAFTVFLAALNTSTCFAGHCDWRLPSEDGQNPPFIGARELESILAAPFPCATNPCVPAAFNTDCFSGCSVTSCSCTQANGYWSATTDAAQPANARLVSFFNGNLGDPSKTDTFYVRALRGGPVGRCFGKPDGTTCDASTDGPVTLTCASGDCAPCAVDRCALPRFVDNRDGTITDRTTCLVWEKKDSSAGIHDLNNHFTWSTGDNSPNGTAFTVLVEQLNGTGFADHSDWRLPTSAGSAELPTGQPPEIESLADQAATGCGSGPPLLPCVDAAFNTNCGADGLGNAGCTINGAAGTQQCSCTAASLYWSSSTVSSDANDAWFEDFSSGNLSSGIAKTNGFFARVVRGGALNPCLGKPDGATCDAGSDAPQALTCAGGLCAPCVADQSAAPRYVDNGDGTLTDRQTCLVWEKKSDDSDVHDKDSTFTWSAGTNAADGTVFTSFLDALNTAPCFAKHCDWRLPSEDGRNFPSTGPLELETLLMAPCSAAVCVPPPFDKDCAPGCAATVCSCTQATDYWSSTSESDDQSFVWAIDFAPGQGGALLGASKPGSLAARAVRGGS